MNEIDLRTNDDQIDMVQILMRIWNAKYFILIFSIIGILTGFVFSTFQEKKYENSITILPNGSLSLNVSSSSIEFLKEEHKISVKSLLSQFIAFANDDKTFKESLDINRGLNLSDTEVLDFYRSINVEFESNSNTDKYHYTLFFTSKLPINLSSALIENLLRLSESKTVDSYRNYLDVSFEEAKQSLKELAINNKIKADNLVKVLEGKIETVELLKGLHKEERIKELNEAIVLAEKLGYLKPQIDFFASYSDNIKLIPLYLFGTEVLGEELRLLTEGYESGSAKLSMEILEFRRKINNIKNQSSDILNKGISESEINIRDLEETIKSFDMFIGYENGSNKPIAKYNLSQISNIPMYMSTNIILIFSLIIGAFVGIVIGLLVQEIQSRKK